MTLLLPFDPVVRARETAPGASLAPLTEALAHELAPLHTRPLPIPEQKARLTRGGGRCPVHGTLLRFDPWSPHAHHCDRCAVDYVGQHHHDWWVMGAQLWTVERAVHAAALYALRGDAAHAQLAERILSELALRYERWPDRDNVLGPSRPFFSTYLESIWLLNAAHALALLEASGRHDVGAVVRDRLLAPSAARIASYPEGRSNRQAWNAAAQLAAAVLLDDRRAVEAQCGGGEGTTTWLLTHALLDDGSWYEGENYHQFAHRGLWYGVQMLRALGRPVSAALDARFQAGFGTPFVGLLPDDTIPARRDAPYAVSVRQWRIAEWCELGLAHGAGRSPTGRPLAALLARLYDGTGTRSDARARSTADAERPERAQWLARSELSWRALLIANAEPVAGGAWSAGSALLPRQGLAVLRRDGGRVYVALEGGVSGGGHGHPDRLGLTLQCGPQRLLDDPGAGSYTERTLHWYRSTLAHHAPLIDGASQQPTDATLRAWDERGGAGWVQWSAGGLASGVSADRAVVVMDSYCVDRLTWHADRERTLTLPLAVDVDLHHAGVQWRSATVRSAGGLEDGFDFLAHIEEACDAHGLPLAPPFLLHAAGGARAWYAATGQVRLCRATTPGPTGQPPQLRVWLESTAAGGAVVGVWTWREEPTEDASASRDAVVSVTLDAAAARTESGGVDGAGVVARVVTHDGTTAAHGPAEHGWHIELLAGGARSSIDLEGRVAPDTPPPPEPTRRPESPAANGVHLPLRRTLGAAHYVRTEQTWEEAGCPQATIDIACTEQDLVVTVEARTGPVVVDGAASDAMPDNPLDNERADVNADGLQWYCASMADASPPAWAAAGLIVPVRDGAVRATPLVPGQTLTPRVSAAWLPDAAGWRMTLHFPRRDLPGGGIGAVRFDCIVNERPPERERRRGQLVLSGGGGFGYLRGDRHDASRGLTLTLPEQRPETSR